MKNMNHLKGVKIHRLTFVEETGTRRKDKRFGWFRCECGTEKEVCISNWVSGNTKSCGCLNAERNQAKADQARERREGRAKVMEPAQEQGDALWNVW